MAAGTIQAEGSSGAGVSFRIAETAPERVAVTESATDTLSLAAILGRRAATLYVSTDGGETVRTAYRATPGGG